MSEYNFMESIREHRSLWCKSDLKFRDSVENKRIWEEIGKTYSLNYDQVKKKFLAVKAKFNKLYFLTQQKSGSGVLKGKDVIYIENYSWLKENVENITKFSESSLILTQTNEYENSHLGTAESYLNQIANPVFELDALDQDTTNKENENPIIIKNIPSYRI
ncbi:uncharacterized protein LOC135925386 [Gordionus sp. m RMFG-2023]|uniref:uncharacterized protein LOC135925386 n=1 Tax=Gordionus sp. m RMFG-2023 TaxID=3053472 RepID=UPI0031FC20FD